MCEEWENMTLTLNIPDRDVWDENNEMFISVKAQKLILSHSLLSISKWESIWKKSFFKDEEKTQEQILSYIKCMTVNPDDIDPSVYSVLNNSELEKIGKYLNDPMTATIISRKDDHHRSNSYITSEILYYDMIALNMDVVVFERWHISRLITLLQVCDIKNSPPKKYTKNQTVNHYRELNEKRLKERAKRKAGGV